MPINKIAASLIGSSIGCTEPDVLAIIVVVSTFIAGQALISRMNKAIKSKLTYIHLFI
jgi:hypothetical protein